jgi:DNA polymerase-1
MSELLGEDEKYKNSGRAKLNDTYLQELRLTWVLWAAEERGMAIDMEFVQRKIAELTPFLEVVKLEMHQEFGFDMNPGSTEDVARALKSVGIEGEWTNPRTGKQKLPEWELERIDHPLAKRVLEYRTAQKMLTGYYEVLANEAKLEDGEWIVHPNFKQNGARTGRTSVTEPALQTIPREKGEVRGAFVSRKGHKLIFADYAGQELRVLAHYLAEIKDTSMKDVFEKGADLHRETAAAILEKEPDQVAKNERQSGKNTNFAIVYGAGSKKIAWMWGRSGDEEFGKRALYRIYDRFPGLRKIKRMTTKAGEERGFVQTVFGRRHRMGPGTPAYRLLNYLIQGTSAELSKYAMIRVDEALIRAGLRARVLLLIHDEIVVEAPDDEVDRALQIMEAEMTNCPMLVVPMEVESAVATRWSDK